MIMSHRETVLLVMLTCTTEIANIYYALDNLAIYKFIKIKKHSNVDILLLKGAYLLIVCLELY